MYGSGFLLRLYPVLWVLLALAGTFHPGVAIAEPDAGGVVAVAAEGPGGYDVGAGSALTLRPEAPAPGSGIRSFSAAAQEVVLWNQPVSTNNLLPYADQDFETAQDSYDIFLADDFTNSVTWEIRSVFVPGYTGGSGCDLDCADSLNFLVYGNDNGIPDGTPDGGQGGGGQAPVWSLSVPPTDPQILLEPGPAGFDSNVTLTLETPTRLPPGTYWFVFYPTMESPPPTGACCQFYRFASDTTQGLAAQVVNPGGAFSFPTVWTSMQSPLTWSMAQQDIGFRIAGVEVRRHALPAAFSILIGQ